MFTNCDSLDLYRELSELHRRVVGVCEDYRCAFSELRRELVHVIHPDDKPSHTTVDDDDDGHVQCFGSPSLSPWRSSVARQLRLTHTDLDAVLDEMSDDFLDAKFLEDCSLGNPFKFSLEE
eukprot:PhM_4_TR5665/c0_g4_i1/m.69765